MIHSNDAHLPSDFELKKLGEHAMNGTVGGEVIPELKPAKADFVMEKRAYSSFFETGLNSLLLLFLILLQFPHLIKEENPCDTQQDKKLSRGIQNSSQNR